MIHKSIEKSENRIGCGGVALLLSLSLWVIGFSALNVSLSWTVEQVMFETSIGVQDFRWINQAIFALLVLIPCILVYLFSNHPWIKKVSWLWMFGAIFSFLCIPVKTLYLNEQNLTSLLQIGAILLMLVVLKLLKARTNDEPQSERKKTWLVGLAAIVGLGLSIPWVMWGSLGSILDTFLAVVVGGLLAILIVQIIFPGYLDGSSLSGHIHSPKLIRDGFVIAVFLLMVCASISQNGSQQLLVMTLPVCGWLVVMFSVAGGEREVGRKTAAGLILSLAVALPLAFFDMDELSMAITGSAGEILDWATQAAFYTLLGILMISIILLANSKVLKIINISQKVNRGLVFFASISFFLIYFLLGQVGFYGDRVFVILKSQADLVQTGQLENVSERRQAVYDGLVSHALQSQAGLRQKLEKWNLKYTSYYLLNAIEVDGGMLVRLLLASDPAVDRILESPQLRPLPKPVQEPAGNLDTLPAGSTWNLSMIGADRVAMELGVDGSGILIGQSDSGVDGRHPEVQSTYRGVSTGDDLNWFDPWNLTPFPVDQSGHGTGTLSVILGENTGVSPGAEWIGCVNLARNLGNPAKYLDCMQFMLAPFPQGGDSFKDGNPLLGANIVNNSWGCPEIEGCDPRIFEPAMAAMKVAGVFMSSAAGNSGNYGCGTVSDPLAIYEDVFTTGSVDLTGNLSSFSSIGPVIVDGSGRTKPDLLAPGEGVTVAYPGGGYSVVSGTSFAAPHLSGIVALMWSANPALIGDIDATTQILLETAQRYVGQPPACGDDTAATGAGIVDAYAAVKAALEY